MTINLKKQNTKQKGSLLFEMLIVISLVAIILSVGTNAMFLSMRSSKASGERDVANTLASGALESTKAITEENWQNIYSLTKNTQHYYPSELEGKWVLVEGDETININNSSYARYIVINNVSRDGTTRNIESSYVSDNDDPSTQKVTVTVSWSDGSPVVISEYFFRWRNKICNQTEWTTAEPGNTVKDCPSATYDEKEDDIDLASGSIKLNGSNGSSFVCGTSTVVGPDALTYGTVVGEDDECWLDRNLGASHVATASNDEAAYGDLYQWGRYADGHQIKNSGTVAGPVSMDTPGSLFITLNASPNDWRTPQNNNFWQGVAGINNPCPSGFRIPTEAELTVEKGSWSSDNRAGAFGSPLKFTAAGNRHYSSGFLNFIGTAGNYWSSTVDVTDSRSLFFDSSGAGMYSDFRAYGLSVRCIKD